MSFLRCLQKIIIVKFGLRLAKPEDDAPTYEEFDELDEKMKKVYQHLNFA